MPYLTVGGSAELHYRNDGTGSPALLLFNGATLPLEFWGPVAERLSQQHRVIRFDPRNAGATRAEGRFTLNDVAADAAALLDRAEVESAVAVGHAWGGRAAQVFARDYPHRVTVSSSAAPAASSPPRTTASSPKSSERPCAPTTGRPGRRRSSCSSAHPDSQSDRPTSSRICAIASGSTDRPGASAGTLASLPVRATGAPAAPPPS